MLIGMADESGSTHDNYFCIAAYLADHTVWRAFDPAWNAVLKTHSVPFLHMKDFAGSRAGFKGWSEARRRALLKDLLDVIDQFPMTATGAAMRLSGFFRLSDPEQAALVGPYMCCFQEVVYSLGLETVFDIPTEKADFVYSLQDEFKTKMRQLWDFSKTYRPYGRRLGALAFRNMRDTPGLQAADLLAYEFRHYYHLRETRPDLGIRYPFRRLLEHQQAFNSRRLRYLPDWLLQFQAKGIYEEAIDALVSRPEAYQGMMNDLLPAGWKPFEGVEYMRVLNRIKPYPVPSEIDSEKMLRAPADYLDGIRRSLWPLMVSTSIDQSSYRAVSIEKSFPRGLEV